MVLYLGCTESIGDVAAHCQDAVQWVQMGQYRTQLAKRLDSRLCGHVAHQRVLGEGTTSEAAQSHVKPVAARLISCCDLFCGLLRTGVQVGAELNVRDGREHRAHKRFDL